MKLLLALLIAIPLCLADSKGEIELRQRLAAAQLKLDAAEHERAALAAALAKIGNSVKANSSSVAKTSETLKSVVETQEAAKLNAALAAEMALRKSGDSELGAAQAAREATNATNAAAAASAANHAQNAALLIVQAFALLALLLGIGERLWNRRKENEKDLRNHEWQLEAECREKELAANVKLVHTLVNSAYTAALTDTLDATRASLVILRANLVLLHAAPTADQEAIGSVTLQIVATSVKVADLTKLLGERATLAAEAAEAEKHK